MWDLVGNPEDRFSHNEAHIKKGSSASWYDRNHVRHRPILVPEVIFHAELWWERGGLVVNASDSGSRGRGFEPHSGQTVLCPSARHIYSLKVLVIPRKQWLCPNMTEKLFTGTLRINQPTMLNSAEHTI